MDMAGMYGPYSMTREASGTSWQPDSTPSRDIEWMNQDTMYMLDGNLNVGYNHQGGPRGADQAFTTNMAMFMANRQLDQGAVGFRSMVSLEPLMGKRGYPELLQTGETADGVNPLIDRQHPHDVAMELALTGNRELTDDSSLLGYLGLPGEPALGPPAFMHRLSGLDNPVAPIGHHWMDSTHITYGVATIGYVWRNVKLEGSTFRGREPDEYHWNIEAPKFDSYSGRLSFNPTRDWSFQWSYGYLTSPEQLYPSNNVERETVSGIYNRTWKAGWSQTTLCFGRNYQLGIDTLNAALLESAVNLKNTHTFFTRLEYVEKDDLVPAVPLSTLGGYYPRTTDYHPFLPNGSPAPSAPNIFGVKQATLGYIYDFPPWKYLQWGLGASVTASIVPHAIESFYGSDPLSYLLFGRLRLGRSQSSPTESAPMPLRRSNEIPAGQI